VFKVAVQTYRALHGDAPQYLRQFTSVADIPTRQRLRSSTSDDLCVPVVRLPTVGRRAFSVAGAHVWNALPADVTSAASLFTRVAPNISALALANLKSGHYICDSNEA